MPDVFEKIRLSPTQFRTVAERRYADAEYLRKSGNNERANGAMYLGGFVLECLLKAKLLEKHVWLQGPGQPNETAEEQRLRRLCYQSHNLAEILEELPEVTQSLEEQDRKAGQKVKLSEELRKLCGRWTIQVRYSPHSTNMGEASLFLNRVKELKECLK